MLTLFIKLVENIHIPNFLLFHTNTKYKQQEEQMTRTHTSSWWLKKHTPETEVYMCACLGYFCFKKQYTFMLIIYLQ